MPPPALLYQISEVPDEDPDYDKKQWKRLFGSLICFATENKKSDSPERVQDVEDEEGEGEEEDSQPIKRAKN